MKLAKVGRERSPGRKGGRAGTPMARRPGEARLYATRPYCRKMSAVRMPAKRVEPRGEGRLMRERLSRGSAAGEEEDEAIVWLRISLDRTVAMRWR